VQDINKKQNKTFVDIVEIFILLFFRYNALPLPSLVVTNYFSHNIYDNQYSGDWSENDRTIFV